MSVRDNPDKSRYEISVGDDVGAFTEYKLHGDVIEFTHTETLDGFEGQGLASHLVSTTLDDVRTRGLKVRPVCPFVRSYIDKHREYVDLVPVEDRAEFGLA